MIIWVKNVFDIFLDILNKMNDNLGQECLEVGAILSEQNWNNCPWFPWKMTVFPVLTRPFPPVLPLNLAFPPAQKLYF